MSIFPLGCFLSETLISDKVYPGRQDFPTKQMERQKEGMGKGIFMYPFVIQHYFLQRWNDTFWSLKFFSSPEVSSRC